MAEFGAIRDPTSPFMIELMANSNPSVLVVDDESTICETLSAILTRNGFNVATARDVPNALALINERSFDILLSDLNIGEPGDGFTVASAMRRRWPEAITLIQTGYPDFETALEAIREQVDDYIVKPVDPGRLLSLLRDKLQTSVPARRVPPTQRVADVISENRNGITAEWLARTKAHPEFQSMALSDEEYTDHLPQKLSELISMLESHSGETSNKQLRAAFEHGRTRKQQQYSVEMLVEEARLLEHCIFDTVQRNLLSINISRIIPDLVQVMDSSQLQMRETLRAFIDADSSFLKKPATQAHVFQDDRKIEEA